MKTNSLNVLGPLYAGEDQLIYSTVLGATATSITISNLVGDTDLVYYLKCRFLQSTGSGRPRIYLNNDSAANYGAQLIKSSSTTVSASQDTSYSELEIYNTSLTSGDYGNLELLLYAKSGYPRIGTLKSTRDVTGTSITMLMVVGFVWSNTADQITSIVFNNTQANGFGIGTSIELYARRTTRN